jgi:AcrR family transcriptional regulator
MFVRYYAQHRRRLMVMSRRTLVLLLGMPKVSQEHLERRRQQILDAAVGCFARQGFHATSMQDIFAAAGLSAGAVYRYFPSKTELIRAIAAEALANVLPVFDGATSGHVTPGIPDVVAALVGELRDGRLARLRPVILQVWAEAVRDEELAELARSTLGQLLINITRLLERLGAEGRIPARTDTAAAGRLVMAMLQGYVIQFAIFGDVPPQQVREAAAALFGG